MVKKIWEVWEVQDKIGSGSFGEVYKAHKKELGKDFYSAIKHISLPKTQDEIEDIVKEGYAETHDDILNYYQDTIDDLVKEIKIMYELRANTNIVDYQDHLITEKQNGEVGFDIYIRMELLKPLDSYIENKNIDENMVIKIGKDLCNALITCDEHNLLHRDIKPANIFVDDFDNFKLGDFGVARKLEKTTYGMSKKGTYNYMSPEIYKGEMANISSDIYSLGIVMYRLLNNNKAPFIDKDKKVIKLSDSEEALMKRMSGEAIPPIDGVSDNLMYVIKKAISFDRKNRYKTPKEMYRDLVGIEKGKKITEDTLDKTVSIRDELDKTVSIYDDLDKTVSIYAKEINEDLPDMNNMTTDDELRNRIRKIMEEEQEKINLKDEVKYITVKRYKEKGNNFLKLLSFGLCFFLFLLNFPDFIPFMTHSFYNNMSLASIVRINPDISNTLFLIDFIVLISFILSIISRKMNKVASYGYLFNLLLLIYLFSIMHESAIKAEIGYYLYFVINLILFLINYKWKLKVISDEVPEESVSIVKEKDEKLEKEYKNPFINKILLIVIVIGSLLCLYVINDKNGNEVKKQTNEINSDLYQVEIIESYVRIRKEPDMTSEHLGYVYRGEVYTVLDTKEKNGKKWLKIKTSTGINGYILSHDDYEKVLSEGKNV